MDEPAQHHLINNKISDDLVLPADMAKCNRHLQGSGGACVQWQAAAFWGWWVAHEQCDVTCDFDPAPSLLRGTDVPFCGPQYAWYQKGAAKKRESRKTCTVWKESPVILRRSENNDGRIMRPLFHKDPWMFYLQQPDPTNPHRAIVSKTILRILLRLQALISQSSNWLTRADPLPHWKCWNLLFLRGCLCPKKQTVWCNNDSNDLWLESCQTVQEERDFTRHLICMDISYLN